MAMCAEMLLQRSTPTRLLVCVLVLWGATASSGCGKNGRDIKPVYGTVTCGDRQVETGRVRFVPIEGTPGPASMGHIVDGQYRIDVRGGVPVGKHRVEVTALRKTGRQVMRNWDGEELPEDETIVLSAAEYGGKNSPLVIEVTTDSDGQFDITIPAASANLN